MENGLKIRVSRMFRSSFGSCRTRNFSDVMEKAIFSPPQSHPLPSSPHCIEPMSPRLRPFPSIFRPKSSHSFSHYLNATHAQKLKESPTKKKTRKTKKKSKNTQMKFKHNDMIPFSYGTKEEDFGGNWWYSSDDDDDETETLFSSKSTSSDSSRSRRSRRRNQYRRKKHDFRTKKGNCKVGVMPLEDMKVKDSFAVVKRSSDPYNDFRTSMVEMIVEKQIFAARDLENLLQCFLSLNSYQHHKIIVEVFTEIYDALFSHWD